MSAAYWKFIGEKIANGVGAKTIQRLGTGGKLLGRAGAVVGIGFLAYEFIKSYKENIENEPAYQEMAILQIELEKWTSAISCLGSEYSAEKEYGSVDEGGAINALYPKKTIKGRGVKDADPREAYTLIGRAMNYIRRAENISGDEQFETKKMALVSQLRKLQLQVNKVDDFRPIQKKLDQMVAEIRPIAAGFSARIYDCSREIQKSLGSNAAWAAISMTTLGLVKKPRSQKG
jgi:hypothetical protein